MIWNYILHKCEWQTDQARKNLQTFIQDAT